MTALVLIWGPLYALATIIATFAVYWGARYFTNSKWPYRVVLGMAVAWPVGDVVLTQIALSQYCDVGEDSHAYKTVENVEGFYDFDGLGCGGMCQDALMSRSEPTYHYVEARAGEFKTRRVLGYMKTATDQYEQAFVPGPGLYRFALETSGHPNCKIYEAWFTKQKGLHADPFYRGKCIATQPIEKVTVKYELFSDYNEKKVFIGLIREYRSGVKLVNSGNIIYEINKKSLVPVLFWSKHMSPFNCPSKGPSLTYRDFLKPHRP